MKKLVTVLLTLLLLLTTVIAAQAGIPDTSSVLRLHILADDDSPTAQSLKLAVRDALTEAITPLSKTASSRAELLSLLDLTALREIAEATLHAHGCTSPVTVALETASFPDRTYDGTLFPTGEYEALRVVIGSGEGKNWWCVLFPPLCFGRQATPVKSFFKEIFGW